MPDPISAITRATGLVKALYDVSERLKNVEARQLVADLKESLVDLKSDLVELKEENVKLKDELQSIKRQVRPEEKVEVRESKYYLREPGKNEHPGPFCVACFSKTGRFVPLIKQEIHLATFGNWLCNVCDKYYP